MCIIRSHFGSRRFGPKFVQDFSKALCTSREDRCNKSSILPLGANVPSRAVASVFHRGCNLLRNALKSA